MPKGIFTALLLTILPSMAFAQIETVTSEATAMEGVWRISYPTGTENFSIWHGPTWTTAADHFCRVERNRANLLIYCLGNGIGPDAGTVTIKDGHVHLAWGSMMARDVIDATLQPNMHFTGSFTFKLAGVDHDAADPSLGTKLILTEGASDPGGKAALLKTILEQCASGVLMVPHDSPSISHNEGVPMTPDDFRGLGGIKMINYLGLSPKIHFTPDNKQYLGKFPIYGVEFENGERICSLNQRADGVLDYYHCV